MAKKRGKSRGAKTPMTTGNMTRAKTAAKASPRPVSRPAVTTKAARQVPAAPSRRPAPAAEPSPLERAERLRDDIQRSKVTHPDPWSYTAKARPWGERAQRLVDDGAAGRDVRRAVAALAAEVEGDRDFQEARRLF